MRQQPIEKAALDRCHGAAEVAGELNHGVKRRELANPLLRCADVTMQRRRAELDYLSCRGFRARQRDHVVSALDNPAQRGRANRSCAAENENAQNLFPAQSMLPLARSRSCGRGGFA